MGALFLSVGATAAWAATDEERSQPRGGDSRGSASERTESRGTESRGSASESTESRNAGSRSSLRATLREDQLPEERQTEPQSEPQPESAATDGAAADGGAIAGVPTATLEAIASCESGGDPTAVSADGTYRGKYQFDAGTWASVGGSGDPAAAPEAEQDYRASLLYQQAGTSPWPNCG